VTHEYTILFGGTVVTGGNGEPDATAVGWAEDTVLAIGTDAEVRAMSRGDSTFVDLRGAFVVARTAEVETADGPGDGAGDAWQTAAGLEVGSRADLVVLDGDPRQSSADRPDAPGTQRVRVLAIIRAGRLVAGSLPGPG
jgi:predicted amidohydrolase YtcJ